MPGGHSLFCSLWRSSGLGIGAPVRVPPAAGHVPPAPPACGPTPCPPCAAAVPPPAPSSPCRSGRGKVAAKAAPAARPGQVGRQPLRGGTPPQCKAKPLRGGPKARPCIAPPPRRSRRRCSGAARPPLMGALGPSAPPARSAALRPALPARPRLRRRPCRSALPTHSPPGVAARGPSLGVPPPSRAGAPAAGCCCSPCPCGGPQFRPPRALAAQAPPSRAFARGGARGTPPAGGSAGRCPGRQGQGKPRAGRQAAHKRGPCLPVPRPAMGKRGGCPALCGPPAPSHSGKRWCFSCLLLLVVSLLLAGSGGWSVVLVVSLAGCCPGLPGRSGPLHWRRLLPVSWRRLQLPAPSGLLVLLSVGWRSCGAGNSRTLGAVPCRWWPRSGCCPLPLIRAVPAPNGGKSDRQREEKPPLWKSAKPERGLFYQP